MIYKHSTPKLLNETEASNILGLKPQTLRIWRCTGKGPIYRKIGGAVRYHPSDIDEYIKKSSRRNTSEPQEATNGD